MLSSFLLKMTSKYERDASISIFIEFFKPRILIHKCFPYEHVKNEIYLVRFPVIGISNGPVAFLAGGVLNLKYDIFLSVSDASESLNN
jgi:hypothetical protein